MSRELINVQLHIYNPTETRTQGNKTEGQWRWLRVMKHLKEKTPPLLKTNKDN